MEIKSGLRRYIWVINWHRVDSWWLPCQHARCFEWVSHLNWWTWGKAACSPYYGWASLSQQKPELGQKYGLPQQGGMVQETDFRLHLHLWVSEISRLLLSDWNSTVGSPISSLGAHSADLNLLSLSNHMSLFLITYHIDHLFHSLYVTRTHPIGFVSLDNSNTQYHTF